MYIFMTIIAFRCSNSHESKHVILDFYEKLILCNWSITKSAISCLNSDQCGLSNQKFLQFKKKKSEWQPNYRRSSLVISFNSPQSENLFKTHQSRMLPAYVDHQCRACVVWAGYVSVACRGNSPSALVN